MIMQREMAADSFRSLRPEKLGSAVLDLCRERKERPEEARAAREERKESRR